jgi:hypothetical protein
MLLNYIFLMCAIQFVISYNIKNVDMPACKNCKHFDTDFTIFSDHKHGICKLYGDKDLITNKINYNLASSAREKDDVCGTQGKNYEEVPNVLFNEILLKFKGNLLLVLLISSTVLQIIIQEKVK